MALVCQSQVAATADKTSKTKKALPIYRCQQAKDPSTACSTPSRCRRSAAVKRQPSWRAAKKPKTWKWRSIPKSCCSSLAADLQLNYWTCLLRVCQLAAPVCLCGEVKERLRVLAYSRFSLCLAPAKHVESVLHLPQSHGKRQLHVDLLRQGLGTVIQLGTSNCKNETKLRKRNHSYRQARKEENASQDRHLEIWMPCGSQVVQNLAVVCSSWSPKLACGNFVLMT